MNWAYLVLVAVAVGAAAIILLKRSKRTIRTQTVQLVEKDKITHDTFLFTFLLADQTQSLGLKVGEHIEVRAQIGDEVVERKYTPVSEVGKKGSFDLLIKIYGPCEKFPQGGKMTQWLDSLAIGQSITIRHPFGRFNYLGGANIRITNFGNAQPTLKKVDHIYMVAGGTGITPLYQVIQAISNNKDTVKLTLLYLNRTEDDILLQNELKGFCSSNPNLKVFYSVDRQTRPEWTGLTGFMNKEKVESTLSERSPSTLYVSCGPPILSNIFEGILTQLGVAPDQIFRF